MNKVIILAFLVLMGQNSWAQIRQFQTSRLMSTAGAGVASVLSTEAAILNPAASAFFSDSSFSYQSFKTSLQAKSEYRNTLPDEFPKNNRSWGAFMADHTGPIKGGTAYIVQNENSFKRERVVLHGAAPMNKNTSMGVSYNYISDTLPVKYSDRHKIHHQASIGITHIIDEDTIVAAVVQDPTRSTMGEERAIVGFQYSLAQRFIIIGDFGARYTKDITDKYVWMGAIQLNIFSDFFLRFGQFYDNITKLKGNGIGIGWIGPRFGVEFAQRYSQQFDSGYYVYKDEKIVDSSLSAILKF